MPLYVSMGIIPIFGRGSKMKAHRAGAGQPDIAPPVTLLVHEQDCLTPIRSLLNAKY